MLHYVEIGLSHLEVPGERALCIYLSGCPNHCKNCHYPALQLPDYGDVLRDNYTKMIDLYLELATCVCFLGEGSGTSAEREELLLYSAYAHMRGLKTALYSGRDTCVEPWMEAFDYIKLGRYREELGALDSHTTNQRMYRKTCEGYVDMTGRFWGQASTGYR